MLVLALCVVTLNMFMRYMHTTNNQVVFQMIN
jgi:hypothetical protein